MTPITLWWRILSEVRPRERSRFLFFMALFGVVSIAQTLGIAGSEALFLARLGPEQLPATFVLASVVTVLGTLLYAVGVGRARNDVLFIRLLLLGAAALFAGLVWLEIPAVLVGVFCLFFLTQATYVNHYWTFIWDYFDTQASKRLLPLFLIGNSAGGAAGGALAVVLMRFAPAEALIAGWALFLLGGAVMLRLARRPLRRWGPLELEERDETSVEAIRGSLSYIRRVALARWLVLSTVGMVLALFVSQYVYLDIFAREFPEAEQLAIFLGSFLALTNLLEIAIERGVTPWLIRRVGVASGNLIHPFLMLLSFAAVAIDYSLGPAVAARVIKEPVENSLAQPIRTLVYSPIPVRFRGRLLSFLEGAVFYSGMALAGAVLLVLGNEVEPLWLCALGGAVSILYLIANLAVRREYLRTLVAQLAEGRLDLAELGGEIAGFEASRLAELWETLLQQASTYRSSSELDLAAVLADRGIMEPVLRAARHDNPRVRRACVRALALREEPETDAVLREALEDSEPEVRLEALRAIAQRSERREELEPAVLARLRDPEPHVRAEASLCVGARGLPVLREMLESGRADDAIPALHRAPTELLDAVLPHVRADDAALRAEALESVCRITEQVPLEVPALAEDLDHADERVRRAAVRALATRPEPEARSALTRALEDPSREVRGLGAHAFSEMGDDALAVVAPYLWSDSIGTVEAAISAIAGVGTARARGVLRDHLRRRVQLSWQALLALHVLPDDGDLGLRFLRAAFGDVAERCRKLAFRVLELLEDAHVMRTVDKVLRFASARERADALEVLENLGDRDTARLLVLMLEEGSIEEKRLAIARFMRIPTSPDEVVAEARRGDDPWLRLAAIRPSPDREKYMERLLMLRQVSLFSGLSLDQLEAMNRLMTEATYVPDEIIIREGDLGSELYILVEGVVQFYHDYDSPHRELLNTQRPISTIGEMAILSEGPRSATAVAAEQSTLLILKGDRVRELILQMPEISFDLFQVLTARVRHAEERLRRAIDAGQISAEG